LLERVRGILRRARARRRRAAASRLLAGLPGSAPAPVRTVAAALERAMAGTFGPEERGPIDRIEALREELCASGAEVRMEDFGAGSRARGPEARGPGTVVTTVGSVCASASKPRFWCGLLFHLARSARPARCLELGTSLGISSAYIGTALGLNGQGLLVSIEGSPAIAALAREHHRRLGIRTVQVREGRFAEVLAPLLAETGTTDLVFIDGHHDEAATKDYFGRIRPSVPDGGIVVFDDIRWSEGMARAWREIRASAGIAADIDLGDMGVVVLGPDGGRRTRLDLPVS